MRTYCNQVRYLFVGGAIVLVIILSQSMSIQRQHTLPCAISYKQDDALAKIHMTKKPMVDNVPGAKKYVADKLKLETERVVPNRSLKNELMSDSHNRTTEQSKEVRICSSEERLAHARKSCPSKSRQVSLDQWLQSLSWSQLKQMTKDWMTDEKHQVLACLHFKVSTSTWRTIFCNNSVPHPLPANHKVVPAECLPQHNVFNLGGGKFSKIEIISRIKSYYKFMVVRHPLDRLLSVYLDKLRDTNPWYPEHMGSKILSKYRPQLAHDVKQEGKGVYFQEFLQYIIDGAQDEHWLGPYNTQCQPCLVDYDAIVKLETFSNDLPQVLEKLEGRSKDTKKNSFSTSQWDNDFVKNAEQYGNVTDTQLKKIASKYELDFSQFGYNYVRRNRSLEISCQVKSESGDMCC